MFLKHRQTYGRARLLLVDEVGVGKTLSLAASAVLAALLDDGPVLILCPSTLTFQWQVELKDKLGVPSAVWLSNKKVWQDHNEHIIKTRGSEDIVRCPFRIAIVSTGLIFHDSEESEYLLNRRYGTVVLDEAHKARRRGGMGVRKDEPNNLLDFMLRMGPRTKHILLATATPIQTQVSEVWDLMSIPNSGTDFVLGRAPIDKWADWRRALPVVRGSEIPADEPTSWEWLRDPLPPGDEDPSFASLRLQLGVPDNSFFTDKGFGSLGYLERQVLLDTLAPGFYREHNPILRHTILRRRKTLEEAGLLEPTAVAVHPGPNGGAAYPGVGFDGLGLRTNHPIDLAYDAAQAFTDALQKRKQGAGFMRTLLLQRICSSFASGRSTAEKLLHGNVPEEEEDARLLAETVADLTSVEIASLRTIIEELSRTEARDPKLAAVKYFLMEHRTEGKTWLEHGCIVFSQYYDTVRWVASELAFGLARTHQARGEGSRVTPHNRHRDRFQDGRLADAVIAQQNLPIVPLRKVDFEPFERPDVLKNHPPDARHGWNLRHWSGSMRGDRANRMTEIFEKGVHLRELIGHGKRNHLDVVAPLEQLGSGFPRRSGDGD